VFNLIPGRGSINAKHFVVVSLVVSSRHRRGPLPEGYV
jgi:hypothetical protein